MPPHATGSSASRRATSGPGPDPNLPRPTLDTPRLGSTIHPGV
jgi:hypothetical protein